MMLGKQVMFKVPSLNGKMTLAGTYGADIAQARAAIAKATS